jgi:hypothetical protein
LTAAWVMNRSKNSGIDDGLDAAHHLALEVGGDGLEHGAALVDHVGARGAEEEVHRGLGGAERGIEIEHLRRIAVEDDALQRRRAQPFAGHVVDALDVDQALGHLFLHRGRPLRQPDLDQDVLDVFRRDHVELGEVRDFHEHGLGGARLRRRRRDAAFLGRKHAQLVVLIAQFENARARALRREQIELADHPIEIGDDVDLLGQLRRGEGKDQREVFHGHGCGSLGAGVMAGRKNGHGRCTQRP